MSDEQNNWREQLTQLSEKLEMIGADRVQDWRDSVTHTSKHLQDRIREAAEALVRYSAEPDLPADAPLTQRATIGLNQAGKLIRTIQEATRDTPLGLDWLDGAVDALMMVADENLPSAESEAAKNEHVVLLHGLARRNLSMMTIEQSLRKRGYTVTNIDYPSTKLSIEKLVDEVIRPKIKADHAPDQPLHFITHSMGGIITRYYLKWFRPKQTGRVVMMSPPNSGSEIVDLFRENPIYQAINGPAGQQLGTDPGSMPNRLGPPDYEVGVIMGDRTVDPLFSMLIPGRNDGKVSVQSAQLDGMTDFLVLPSSHTFIMHNPLAVQQTLHFLAHGTFDHS